MSTDNVGIGFASLVPDKVVFLLWFIGLSVLYQTALLVPVVLVCFMFTFCSFCVFSSASCYGLPKT